ncbi:MAG: 16S rRNA (cytosine(967)-C(5))-methyltransferase RsmB [Firmicutes bacterium HGW-Firmicutes-16]|nr:MAG: 16S rRNA (cytosine(967)-C(5))-methyltransferase RsmB [Firmicutes bacterium HGW-Firmicutes-16]
MAKSAREAALTVLERCRRDQAFSDALIGSVIQTTGLDSKDSALCTRLCYGVLQNMLLCDFYIDKYVAIAQKLEPKVRDILRISVYQILFLDRIPTHAAVSEGVELCKKLGFARASGLVNAVLRRIAENKDKLPAIPDKDLILYLSIKYSTPAPLVKRLADEFGNDFTEGLLKANNEAALLTIQVNTLKTTSSELCASLESKGIESKRHELLIDCLEISGTGDITSLDEYKNGLFYVQDAAARLAVLASGAKNGDTVLDACSAPGGKSFASALMMQNAGKILSCDIHENKLVRVREGAERLGIGIISTGVMDAAKPDEDSMGAFDLVIADVPCSGLGVIRKKPDIRYKDLKEIERLPETQLAILDGLSNCVKPGGALLYSTCTVLEAENGGVIDRFLKEHKEFSAEGFNLPEPIGNSESGRLNLYPHIHHTDGFFICKLRKHNEN